MNIPLIVFIALVFGIGCLGFGFALAAGFDRAKQRRRDVMRRLKPASRE